MDGRRRHQLLRYLLGLSRFGLIVSPAYAHVPRANKQVIQCMIASVRWPLTHQLGQDSLSWLIAQISVQSNAEERERGLSTAKTSTTLPTCPNCPIDDTDTIWSLVVDSHCLVWLLCHQSGK